MARARVWIFGLGLAFLAVACKGTSGGATGTGGGPGTGGISGTTCPGTQMACGTDCIDTSSDPVNCGACGLPCAAGYVCQGGSCQCQSGLMLCNGSCVASDATHCGSCSVTCQGGQVCSNGTCTSSCATGLTLCGSGCDDTTTSSTNCGGCGTVCGSTQHCAGSNCVANVTTGSGGTPGTGGATATGGSTGSGGAGTGTGGSSATGGAIGTGGSGGSTATGGAPGTGGAPPTQSSVVTSASGSYWKSGTLTTVTSGSATVTVNDSSTAQTWEGFGGAFNEAGWSNLSMLSQSDRDSALQLLYGADGAHFNIGRVPIGANDYSISRYTDDEVASGSTDYNMTSFSLTQDMKYLIPYIKAAQAVNGSIRFWGSPWTPPTWMKTSSGSYNGTACTFSGTAFDSGCMMDNAQVLAAYAQYFVKWVQGYAAQGITIEAIGPQNEPNYFDNYPSCGWTPALFTKFVGQYLGPAFTTASLTTKIMLGTMSNADSGKDPDIVSAVLASGSPAKPYIKLFGYQWNMQPNVASAKSNNLPIWQTEHKCGNYPWSPPGFPTFNPNTAANDYAYGVESWGYIHDWIGAGVTAYNAWNTVLDTAGKNIDSKRAWPQNALMTVNTSTRALTVTPAFYVFRHCSQYVSAGAKVVATSGSGSSLGFKNPDGSIVTVMYNSGAASTYTLAVASKKLQFAMPANGFATVVYVP